MRDVTELVDGYQRFLETRYPDQASRYRALADMGQAPKTMVIACCDSRVDPAVIFDAGPGELFVVRNVANLVPPFERHGNLHGTSAALEFAVTGLEVETILVMGHGRCGGVRAYLDGLYGEGQPDSFINSWMSLLSGARVEALRETGGAPRAAQERAVEFASVRLSIETLRTFPFVREREAGNTLRLRGAYFDIADGKLLSLDAVSGQFVSLA